MSSEQKIGFLCSGRSWGGLEMHVLKSALWLRDRGLETHILSHPDSPLYEKAGGHGLTCHQYTAITKAGAVAASLSLAKLFRREQLKTIVLHSRPDMLGAVLAKVMSRTPFNLIYQQHMQLGGNKRDLYHTWLFNHLDAWITPLTYHSEQVRTRTRIPPERIVQIPFGIDLSELRSGLVEKATARRSLELPENATVVGVIGRVDPKKGQDTLVEAVKLLHDRGRNIHALIVGARTAGEATEFELKLHQLVEHDGLTEYVHFRPYLAEVGKAYSALDIFALTSHSETYGLVTLEAMASGVPVIGTDRSGTAAIVDHERTGLLFPPRDPQSLASCIARLLDDDTSRRKMIVEATREVESRYSHVVQVDELTKLLDRLQT